MNVKLAHNNYGESRIRLLRVMRRGSVHELKDLTLAIHFEGDFDAAHTAGDNRKILPTEYDDEYRLRSLLGNTQRKPSKNLRFISSNTS